MKYNLEVINSLDMLPGNLVTYLIDLANKFVSVSSTILDIGVSQLITFLVGYEVNDLQL